MSTTPPPNPERIDELFVLRATEGLSAAEAEELEALLRASGVAEETGYDEAAAALARSETGDSPMPAGLMARLEADAGAFFNQPAEPGASDQVPASDEPAIAGRIGPVLGFVAGVLSTAAVLFFAMPFLSDVRTADRDSALPGVVWQTTGWSVFDEGYEQVSGSVEWSADGQRGMLRLANLPVNDPAEAQYQLWIVDPTRDDEPVDGGVFDMPETPRGGEAVIPFAAKLPVDRPTAFAITLEKPGGVVVSEGPLLVTALMPQG